MKYLFSFLFVNIFLFTSNISVAQSAKIKTVQIAVDKLKAAMISNLVLNSKILWKSQE